MKLISILFWLAFALRVVALPAFPGAEGFGANAVGGRGGDVYVVTNLNSSGAGSFYNGLTTIPSAGRTIVFAVSGPIHLAGGIATRITASNLTIAGQTAPGDGILLKDGTLRISGDDIVIRHLRFRHGKYGSGGDCIDLDSGCLNAILDHLSMSFSTDENISSFSSPPENITMQWSFNAWGLESHSCGGLWDQNHATCHHSLWAHNHTRNPKARPAGLLEWANNVTFDWDIGFIMGDSDTPAAWKANVMGNYFICPPGNIHNTPLEKAGLDRNGYPNFSVYQANNLHDNDGNGVLSGTDRGWSIVSGTAYDAGTNPTGNYLKLASPVTGSALLNVDSPLLAYKKIVSNGGALRLDTNQTNGLRDEVDTRLIQNLTTQTRNHITRESDLAGVSNSGFGTLNATTPPSDLDIDGMPDFWETALGFGVTSDDHNTVFANNGTIITATTFFPANTPAGYTYLEEYLHFLAIPHGTIAKNTAADPSTLMVDLSRYTSGFTSAPSFGISNVTGGSIQQLLANGTTPAANGSVVKFTPTLNLAGRGGFDFTVTDADGSSWTQHFAILISSSGIPRSLNWKGGLSSNAWDESTSNWIKSNGAATVFSGNDSTLFDDSGSNSPAVSVPIAVTPSAVVVTGTKNYTFSGAGGIASSGPLTKAGTTTLTLGTNMSFGGGTYLNGGETIISNNYTLSGGAIRFSGGSTLTVNHNSSSYFVLGPNIQVDFGAIGNINLSQRAELNGSLSGGGTFNIYSPSTLGTEGRVYFDGASAGCSGTVNLSGGALAPGAGGRVVFRINDTGSAFNGFGSARVNLFGIDLFNGNNSAGNVYPVGELGGDANSRMRGNYLNGGGATTWSVGGLNTNSTFTGAIMDGVGLTQLAKVGSGTLYLTGNNSYTGATTVSAGALVVSGALGASPVTVANGAKIGGNGTLGSSLTLSSGATVDPGSVAGVVGTLTVANGLTLSSGCNLFFDLSSSPAGANDRISVAAGSLAQVGTINFKFSPSDGYLGPGNYNLVTDAPNSSASSPVFTHNFPSNTRQTFSIGRSSTGATGTKSIWLTVGGTAGDLLWTGTSSVWDIANTVSWSGGGAADNKFYNLDNVTFSDTASNRTVTLSAALQPTSVLVSNGGSSYTFDGTGNLTGATLLTKRGNGTLTISNTTSNSYTGGTFIESGTLALSNALGLLGSGNVGLKGGNLVLPNTATYLSNSMVVSANSSISSPYSGASTIINSTSSTLSSTGNPTLDLSGVRGILSVNGGMSGFAGTVSFGSGSGMLRLNSNSSGAADVNFGSASAHFDLGSGSSRLCNRNGNVVVHLGALSGGTNTQLNGRQTAGSDASTTTYIIGERNLSTVFSGSINHGNDVGGLGVIKTGTGVLTLGGTSNFDGSISVNQGELVVSGSSTVSGTTTVEVGGNLTLTGGFLGVEALNVAGAIGGYGTVVGEANVTGSCTGRGYVAGTAGALQITGPASFDACTFKMLGGVKSDRIDVAGDLAVSGTFQIALATSTTTGRYTLMTYGGSLNLGSVSLTGISSSTNAHLSTSVPGQLALVIDDADEDGLSDIWEVLYFGNLLSGTNDDADGDGQSNAIEYLAGTNPKSGSSCFRASLVGGVGGKLLLSWPSVPGKAYAVESHESLIGPWTTVTSVFGAASPAATTSFTVTRDAARKFYRVRLGP